MTRDAFNTVRHSTQFTVRLLHSRCH